MNRFQAINFSLTIVLSVVAIVIINNLNKIYFVTRQLRENDRIPILYNDTYFMQKTMSNARGSIKDYLYEQTEIGIPKKIIKYD